MLTPADDYPLHQTPEPIAIAAAERNFYDRYFFNGHTPDGELFFAAALGAYPVLGIMDAAFSVRTGGRQHNLRASRHQLPLDRLETAVGPIRLTIEQPLKRLRLDVEHDAMRATLELAARGPAHQEPRFVHRRGPRTVFDYTRLTQPCAWRGSIAVGSAEMPVEPSVVIGIRDRSWGVRPIGLPDSQGPPAEPQFYWLWAPTDFGDFTTLFHENQDATGQRWSFGAARLAHDELVPERIQSIARGSAELELRPGTRRVERATIALGDASDGARIELLPRFEFYMTGLGYLHPEWGHGMYRGDLDVTYDSESVASEAPPDLLHLHVQSFCEAELIAADGGRRSGRGVLEQLIVGPHEPLGLLDLLGPAPAQGGTRP